MSLALVAAPVFLNLGLVFANNGGLGDDGDSPATTTTADTRTNEATNNNNNNNEHSTTNNERSTEANTQHNAQTTTQSTATMGASTMVMGSGHSEDTSTRTHMGMSTVTTGHSAGALASYNQWGFEGTQSVWQDATRSNSGHSTKTDDSSALTKLGSSSTSSSSSSSSSTALLGARKVQLMESRNWKLSAMLGVAVGATFMIHCL